MSKEVKLTDNVYLHLVPTQQFATVTLEVALTSEASANQLAQRSLAASMVENASDPYPSQTDLARALSKLFGATYEVDIQRYGRLQTIRVRLTVVDGRYAQVETASLVAQALDFLRTMLFQPLGSADQGFDMTVFNRQRDNLLDQLASVQDNPALWAQRQALEAYFDDDAQAMPSCGDQSALENSNPLDVWLAWQYALLHDRIDITVVGAIDDRELLSLISMLPFGPRQTNLTATYRQPLRKVARYQEDKATKQSQFVAIFQVVLTEEDRFAAWVFNAIFGGLAVSRLFTRVREQAGLAYDIQTELDWPRRILIVTAGVEPQAIKQVEKAVMKELTTLQESLVSRAELAQAKGLLTASYLTSLDNPDQISQRFLIQGLRGETITADSWVKQMQAVTALDVQAIAKHVVAQVQYEVLGGKENESATV